MADQAHLDALSAAVTAAVAKISDENKQIADLIAKLAAADDTGAVQAAIDALNAATAPQS